MPKIINPPLHPHTKTSFGAGTSKEEIIQKKRSRVKALASVLVASALFFGLVFGCLWAVSHFKWPGFVYNKFFTEKPSRLWAVYLNAGNSPTTYYGEIVKWGSDYIILKNPAYIDVRQPQEGATEPTVTFRRLSEEFYKPKPEAKIFKQNIIFLQELSSDSPIHEAYKQAPVK